MSTTLPSRAPDTQADSISAGLLAVSRRSRDALIVRILATLADELRFSPALRGGMGGSSVPAMGAIRVAVDHLVRCVDDGAPAEVVAGRAAAISGSLAAASVLP